VIRRNKGEAKRWKIKGVKINGKGKLQGNFQTKGNA